MNEKRNSCETSYKALQSTEFTSTMCSKTPSLISLKVRKRYKKKEEAKDVNKLKMNQLWARLELNLRLVYF